MFNHFLKGLKVVQKSSKETLSSWAICPFKFIFSAIIRPAMVRYLNQSMFFLTTEDFSRTHITEWAFRKGFMHVSLQHHT